MERKNTITRAELKDIETKLDELISIIDKYEYLCDAIPDLECLYISLFFLEHKRVKTLKLID